MTVRKLKPLSKTNRRFLMRLYDSIWVLGRPRTSDALGLLAHRLPARLVGSLPNVRVYAPQSVWGEVLRLPCSGEILLYLSPDLETLPQRCVSYVVAHEFAHVALGHYGLVLGTRIHLGLHITTRSQKRWPLTTWFAPGGIQVGTIQCTLRQRQDAWRR